MLSNDQFGLLSNDRFGVKTNDRFGVKGNDQREPKEPTVRDRHWNLLGIVGFDLQGNGDRMAGEGKQKANRVQERYVIVLHEDLPGPELSACLPDTAFGPILGGPHADLTQGRGSSYTTPRLGLGWLLPILTLRFSCGYTGFSCGYTEFSCGYTSSSCGYTGFARNAKGCNPQSSGLGPAPYIGSCGYTGFVLGSSKTNPGSPRHSSASFISFLALAPYCSSTLNSAQVAKSCPSCELLAVKRR